MSGKTSRSCPTPKSEYLCETAEFRLREWSREQIVTNIEAAGFRKEYELTDKFPGSGEVYLLFRRNSSAQNRPAGSQVSMAEDPKDVFRRAIEAACHTDAPEHLGERRTRAQRQREAQPILKNLREQRVFYYPGAGLDWEPLRRLTHLCDTFIFCDDGVAEERVGTSVSMPGLVTDFFLPLDTDTVADLSNPAGSPANIATPPAVGPPWGKYARLTRSVGEDSRPIHLFYLGMNAVTAFFNLFIPESTAPKVIFLNFSSRDFPDWDGPLGQLVRMCETRPTFLVGGGGRPIGTWPYTVLWQRFGGWFPSWVTHDYRPEPVQPNPLGGTRKVIVRHVQMTPESVADCEVIVLPVELYMEHQQHWPVGASILLLAPPDQAGQLHGQPDNVVFLGRRYAPLGDVLERITETCAKRAVSRVASVFIGYENEGPGLDQWRRQAGMPLQLTIYCEHGGDVVSFGPHADEIH